MKIAVSGKGGVGKTSVSASLAKLFAKDSYKVYVVDADPDTSLGLALGIPEQQLLNIIPLSELEEVIKEKSGGAGALFTLNPQVDDILEEYAVNYNNIRFLRMGAIKQGGSSCYCRENVFLQAVVNELLLGKDELVILDMGAGIEHLTRGTAQGVDLMLIVTEPTPSSVQTGKVVQKLAEDLSIKNIKFIANKVRNNKEEKFLKGHFSPAELAGIINFDEEFLDMTLEGSTSGIPEGSFGEAIRKIYNNIRC